LDDHAPDDGGGIAEGIGMGAEEDPAEERSGQADDQPQEDE
jgi:hypothetical protein